MLKLLSELQTESGVRYGFKNLKSRFLEKIVKLSPPLSRPFIQPDHTRSRWMLCKQQTPAAELRRNLSPFQPKIELELEWSIVRLEPLV